MSILIEGIERPRRCMDCELEIHDDYELTNECPLIYKGYTNEVRAFKRLEKCPILCDVPEPHGRLIDADAFKRYCQIGMEDNADLFHDGYKAIAEALTSAFLQDIDEQPTVIPVSEKEE